jgi:CDP-diacylglycerol--serine O-phosphatidyltransferase
LLPNLITSASLRFGFWSIVMSIQHSFERAALFIIVAGICDTLDGRIARATRSTSRFGVEYDSISDMVSFGMAPALLVYVWALQPLGNRGWLIAALFALCAALRLARFNIQTERGESRHYQGIPSTIAGGIVASTVFFTGWLGLNPPFSRPLGLAVTTGFAILALLMVSPIPYPSWKSLHVPRRHAYPALVAIVLGGVGVILNYEWTLFALGMIFMASGPILWWMERPSLDAGGAVTETVGKEPKTESRADV